MVSNNYYDSKGNIHNPSKNEDIRFRLGCYSLCKNSKGEYLLILNSNSNTWEFPGGGVEIGEDLEEAAIREVKEETGYDIKLNSDLPYFIERDLSYSRSKKLYQHEVHFFYEATLISDVQGKQNFAEGENIEQVKFFSLEELKDVEIVHWQKVALKKFLNKK